MYKYKLVRIVNGRYLSANQAEQEPTGDVCLEYKVGEITSVGGMGVACYKRKAYALQKRHINETRNSFNHGNPIALLRLKSIGEPTYEGNCYKPGYPYAGGINYASVEVLEATQL